MSTFSAQRLREISDVIGASPSWTIEAKAVGTACELLVRDENGKEWCAIDLLDGTLIVL